MARAYTIKLLEMLDEGILDKDNVILACVQWMSEEEVHDMMHANEFLIEDEEEEEFA